MGEYDRYRDIGKLKKVETQDVHIVSVTTEPIRPAHVETVIIEWQGEPYEGDYEVTPRVYEQILGTKHKTMSDDVTVREIPISMVTNPSGGQTVLIG